MNRTWTRSQSGLVIPTHTVNRRRPIAVDFFCGAGGFSLGTIQAGFEVIAGFDNDPAAAMTYMYNLCGYPCQIHFATESDEDRLERFLQKHAIIQNKEGEVVKVNTSGSGWIKRNPEHTAVSHFFFGDIRKWTGERILNLLGLDAGDIDLVMGGPPCQGFSSAGKRDVMDPRNSLVFDFARLIVALNPKSVVMENVPEIVSMITPEGLPVLDVFCGILEDGHYGVADALKRSLTRDVKARAMVRGRAAGRAKKKEDGAKKKTPAPTLFDAGMQ